MCVCVCVYVVHNMLDNGFQLLFVQKRDEPVWATVEDFCCAVSFIDHVTRFPLVNNVTPRCHKKVNISDSLMDLKLFRAYMTKTIALFDCEICF